MVTVSFNLYFTRPASSGLMRAEGRLSHASSRLYIAESTLTDEQGKLLAQGSGTFMKTSTPLGEFARVRVSGRSGRSDRRPGGEGPAPPAPIWICAS